MHQLMNTPDLDTLAHNIFISISIHVMAVSFWTFGEDQSLKKPWIACVKARFYWTGKYGQIQKFHLKQ